MSVWVDHRRHLTLPLTSTGAICWPSAAFASTGVVVTCMST